MPSSLATYEAGKPEQTGQIRDARLREVSGLAESRRRPGAWWVLNDSGNPPALYLVSGEGELLAVLDVAQAVDRDWEDLAAYTDKDGVPWLVIGDVGDNAGRRAQVELLFVREPELPESNELTMVKAGPERRVVFRYEDGPRDCEGLAVDTVGNQLLLLSKRDKIPCFYTLPLDAAGDDLHVATKLEQLKTIAVPDGVSLPHPFGRQPTAMDISADCRLLGVLTYSRLLVFERGPEQTWQQALTQAPRVLALPPLRQAEAFAFDLAGRELWVTTEQLPAPIFRWRTTATDAPAAVENAEPAR